MEATLRQLTEQVASQAYSKKDIERLKCERARLRQVYQDVRADVERVDQDIWDTGMKESISSEAIGRLMQQVNESAESLDDVLTQEGGPLKGSHAVELDLSEPAEVL